MTIPQEFCEYISKIEKRVAELEESRPARTHFRSFKMSVNSNPMHDSEAQFPVDWGWIPTRFVVFPPDCTAFVQLPSPTLPGPIVIVRAPRALTEAFLVALEK